MKNLTKELKLESHLNIVSQGVIVVVAGLQIGQVSTNIAEINQTTVKRIVGPF